jgi:hypothetical protein
VTLQHWTTVEERVLLDHYASGGVMDCLAKLPGRSVLSIYARARKIGLKTAVKASPYKQWQKSDHVDEAIRLVYQTPPKRGAVDALATKLMRPRWWISKRARDLGLVVPRLKELPWSDEEIDLLEQNAHKSPDRIARILKGYGYARSVAAIIVKRKRNHLGPRENPDPENLCANQLAKLMGVDAKTITRWIELEGLPATRRGTKRVPQQGGDQWQINLGKLRLWIGSHALQVDLRKVDRFWFIDLMVNRKT